MNSIIVISAAIIYIIGILFSMLMFSYPEIKGRKTLIKYFLLSLIWPALYVLAVIKAPYKIWRWLKNVWAKP